MKTAETKAQGLNETTGGDPDEVADKPMDASVLGADIHETTGGDPHEVVTPEEYNLYHTMQRNLEAHMTFPPPPPPTADIKARILQALTPLYDNLHESHFHVGEANDSNVLRMPKMEYNTDGIINK